MRTSTTALCQWGFGYAQDTDNKYREAKGAIWEKCFYQVNNIYLQVYYVTRLFTIQRLGDYQYIKQLRLLVL